MKFQQGSLSRLRDSGQSMTVTHKARTVSLEKVVALIFRALHQVAHLQSTPSLKQHLGHQMETIGITLLMLMDGLFPTMHTLIVKEMRLTLPD